ncbi:hypothetical protein [Mesorhizobium sp. ZC-5]|uniref:hypothetical protein n=1 Tax=Mesorhizobium sp. ZC-5 TaxID=2986066 RepID=UPI0021E84943|nr:hypothetical protein [Mesorhizobium sp. ZC-5]MCV3239333.1 hypothetical protein [Mesorhizobium sp. ZC-5]
MDDPLTRFLVPWTEEELERLRQLAAHNERIGSIARKLGRTRIGIRARAVQDGIRLREDDSFGTRAVDYSL